MAARARVVIATYDRLPFLRLALRGYLRQTIRDFTIVVADDGSDDGTEEHVRAFSETAVAQGIRVRYVRPGERSGRAGAGSRRRHCGA